MPELAEVEFFRKQWSSGIGKTVQNVLLHPKARIFRETDPDKLQRELTGARLLSSEAHGKQMRFHFSGKRHLGIHLGMAGRLQPAAPEIIPDKHEHLVLVMDTAALVFADYRMFGKVLFEKGSGEPAWWQDLSPQPQDPAFDKARLRSLLKRHARRPLKALLLDQQGFPGIGNWMADEILWRARIHPATTPSHLSPGKRYDLYREIKAVCADALEVIGADWSNPPDSWLFNHRWKDGGRCPRTGKPLARETIGGRTTCFCPAIQKEKQ